MLKKCVFGWENFCELAKWGTEFKNFKKWEMTKIVNSICFSAPSDHCLFCLQRDVFFILLLLLLIVCVLVSVFFLLRVCLLLVLMLVFFFSCS